MSVATLPSPKPDFQVNQLDEWIRSLKRNAPRFEVLLSDTFGPYQSNPLAYQDIEVHILTDLARLRGVLEGGNPLEIATWNKEQKWSVRGREEAVRHILDVLERWHDRYADLLREAGVYNSVFVNKRAARDKKGQSAAPFVEFETDSGLRVVTTPAVGADILKPHIVEETLYEIPNEHNGLFENDTQFRSETAHLGVRQDSSHRKRPLSIDDFPDDPTSGELRTRWIDPFGNIIHGGGDTSELVRKLLWAAESGRNQVEITIHDGTNGRRVRGEAAASMNDGTPDSVIVYPNGEDLNGNRRVDVSRKWVQHEDDVRRALYNACRIFQFPKEQEARLHVDFINLI